MKRRIRYQMEHKGSTSQRRDYLVVKRLDLTWSGSDGGIGDRSDATGSIRGEMTIAVIDSLVAEVDRMLICRDDFVGNGLINKRPIAADFF